MPNPTKRAQKAVSALAKLYGLTLKDKSLSNRSLRIHTLYAGGSRLLGLLDSVDICFAQCGSKGNWVALLPAEKLMQVLETEKLHNTYLERVA